MPMWTRCSAKNEFIKAFDNNNHDNSFSWHTNIIIFVGLKSQFVKKDIIEQAFDKFSEQKVIVIEDTMVDSYLWRRADRVPFEAPVPVVTVTKQGNCWEE
jgi:hypothetical protein